MEALESVLASLERAPRLLHELVAEMPPELRKKRKHAEKWSLHEHACHVSVAQELFEKRMQRMLDEDCPVIRPYLPHKDDDPGRLLAMDLNETLHRFSSDRRRLIERLRQLTVEQWQRTARHTEYARYTVYIMFRHLALHDLFHMYRMEELLLDPVLYSRKV
jgi:hypothetical protein